MALIYLPVCLLADGFKQNLDLVQPPLLLCLALVEVGGAGAGLDLQVDSQLLSNLRKFSRDDLAELIDNLRRVLILNKRGNSLHISTCTC